MCFLLHRRKKNLVGFFIKRNLSLLLIIASDTTVRLGHSNSLVVVGPRGSGKTLAVERALSTLEDRYNKQRADPLVGVIRLVGWAHADERTAFKEVATQLCS